MSTDNTFNQRLFKFAEDTPYQRAARRMGQATAGSIIVNDPLSGSPVFYLLDTGWVKFLLPRDEEKASIYHDAVTHKDSPNWLARIYPRGGKFSSDIHPKATFAQVANAVMEHGAYPCFQSDAASEAGINTVLAVALRSCECGVRERGIRISRGETNV